MSLGLLLDEKVVVGQGLDLFDTVTVPHLNAAQAEELAKAYFGAQKTEE